MNFLRKTWAVFKRDALERLSYKFSFLFDAAGICSSILIFFFVAKLVGPDHPALAAYGGDYFPFVLIGLAFAGYQTTALNSLGSTLSNEQGNGTLEAILITPTHLNVVLLAGSLWSFFYTTVRVLVYLAIGALFFGADLSQTNFPALIIMVILTTASLMGFGAMSAGFLLIFKQGTPVNYLLNGLSKFLGGVYFPVTIFPGWLQAVSHWIPLTHALNGIRGALIQGKTLGEMSSSALILMLWAVVLIPLGFLVFSYALRRAKKDGSLIFV